MSRDKIRIRYESIPCSNCGNNTSFPFTNDGGSILICEKCKHIYPANKIIEKVSEQTQYFIPSSWGNFTSSSSDFATLESMNKYE